MSSSQLNHPSFPTTHRLFSNNDGVDDEEEEEEQKEDEYIPENGNRPRSIPSHISSAWISLQQLYHSEDLQSQTTQTRIFLSLMRDLFLAASPQTQICLCVLSFGLTLILIQLPMGILFGILLVSIGISGIVSITTQQYIKFSQETGLISFLRPGIIKDFILDGSIVEIFYEIRNSNLGIPDFLLSQILPLDEPEREIIFERLPDITRNVVSTEGLIYLTPQPLQNLILPLYLQRNNEADLQQILSPDDDSPYAQIDFSEFKPVHQSSKNGMATHEEQPLERADDLVTNTRNELEQAGMKWLWKHQDHEEDDIKVNTNKKGTTYVLQSTKNGHETEVIESTTDLDSSSSNDEEDIELKRDIVDEQYQVSVSHDIGKEHRLQIPQVIDTDTKSQDAQYGVTTTTAEQSQVSWIGQMSKLFSEKMLGKNANLGSKAILKTVIDTRMKELVIQVIRSVWKSPFSGITDAQLVVIFVCCLGGVSYHLTKNKKARNKFVKSLKYMGFMALVWIAILSFIELNIRRKSKVVKRIFRYINKQLFHSKHHKEVRDRKKSYSELSKSKSMRMYSAPMTLMKSKMRGSLSRQNLLSGMERQIRFRDKKSKFSRTMPYIPGDTNQETPTSPRSVDSLSTSEFGSPMTPMTPTTSTPMTPITDRRGKFQMSLMDIPDDKKLKEAVVRGRAKSVSFA